MSTSQKTPASIRTGGPGASHENAKDPSKNKQDLKPAAQGKDDRSQVSGGGGERDYHHTRDPERKGG